MVADLMFEFETGLWPSRGELCQFPGGLSPEEAEYPASGAAEVKKYMTF
jgi:hypothetical protein